MMLGSILSVWIDLSAASSRRRRGGAFFNVGEGVHRRQPQVPWPLLGREPEPFDDFVDSIAQLR